MDRIAPPRSRAARVALLGASAALAACGAAVDSGSAGAGPQASDEVAAAAPGMRDNAPTTTAPAPELTHAAAGYLRLERAALDPWCGAVLVAPDVAVTTAYCVAGRAAGEFTVGFGRLGEGARHRVARIVVHPEYRSLRAGGDGSHNLAALVLAAPVPDVAPARVATAPVVGCSLEAVSYTFVARGDAQAAADRRTIAGCAMPSDATGAPGVRFPEGVPNCHGDNGAGVFVRDGATDAAAVLGVVSHARGEVTNPRTGLSCADTLHVSALATEAAFLAQFGVTL